MPIALICTPEPAVAETLRVLLGIEWTVFTETSALGALGAADDVPADAYFVDEYLPDAQLVDVVQALRARSSEATIIALALGTHSPRVEVAIAAGLDEVLTKPFDRDQVGLVVHRINKRVNQVQVAEPAHPDASAAIPPAAQPELPPLVPTLRALVRAATHITDAPEVGRQVLGVLCDVLGVNRGVVLWTETEEVFGVLAGHGVRHDRLAAVVFRADCGLAAWLRRHNRMCAAPLAGQPSALPRIVRQELQLLQAALAVPLVIEGRLRGILAVGNRVTGAPFSAQDLDVILSLAQYAGTLVGNASAQAAARGTQRRFEGIVDHLASGIVMVDAEGQLQVVNDVAARVLGVQPDEVLGAPAHRLGSLIGDLLLRTLAGDETYHRHRVTNPATGHPLGVNTSLLRDEAGTVQGAIMVCTSLVDVPAAEPGTGLDTWYRFALGMAHAIKNPLVAIKTFTQLYPDRYDDAEFRDEFHPVAAREVDRLDRLVESLMQYGGEGLSEQGPCDLHDVVESAVASQACGGSDGAPVHVEHSAEPLEVLGDPEQLREAISQLILNAREAAGADGEVWACVHASTNGRRVAVVDVEDNGPGLAADAAAEACSPFYTTKDKGLGLGLALAERVVRLHGGEVQFSRSVHGGAKVSVLVPLQENGEETA